jgi:hypothetical protein
MRGERGVAGSQPMSTVVQITWHGAQNKLWRSTSIFNLGFSVIGPNFPANIDILLSVYSVAFHHFHKYIYLFNIHVIVHNSNFWWCTGVLRGVLEIAVELWHTLRVIRYECVLGPCFYWVHQTQLNTLGLVLIGCARLSRWHFQIKNFSERLTANAKVATDLGSTTQWGAADKAVLNKLFKSPPKQIPLHKICGDHSLHFFSIRTLSRL